MAKKNQAKRSGNSKSATPAWLWGLIGTALGLVIAAYFFMGDYFKATSNTDQPQPNAAAEAPAKNSDDAVAQEPIEKPKPKYDFYELLPGKEVIIPDADLEAQAEAEARAARNKPVQLRPVAAADTPAPVRTPVDATIAPPAPNVANSSNTPASNPDPVAAPIAVNDARFLLQAGAFRNAREAENLKASIAMTGEVARIESAEINGTTVYRVRLGPYATASSLSSAKQALSVHGIEGQAIKVK
jgi:cell division protein FtsN